VDQARSGPWCNHTSRPKKSQYARGRDMDRYSNLRSCNKHRQYKACLARTLHHGLRYYQEPRYHWRFGRTDIATRGRAQRREQLHLDRKLAKGEPGPKHCCFPRRQWQTGEATAKEQPMRNAWRERLQRVDAARKARVGGEKVGVSVRKGTERNISPLKGKRREIGLLSQVGQVKVVPHVR
jgi:hypothetical protein